MQQIIRVLLLKTNDHKDTFLIYYNYNYHNHHYQHRIIYQFHVIFPNASQDLEIASICFKG